MSKQKLLKLLFSKHVKYKPTSEFPCVESSALRCSKLYRNSKKNKGMLKCIDFLTGKFKWKSSHSLFVRQLFFLFEVCMDRYEIKKNNANQKYHGLKLSWRLYRNLKKNYELVSFYITLLRKNPTHWRKTFCWL